MLSVQVIRCPSCGASQDSSAEACPYCGNKLIISSYSDVSDMPLPKINKYIAGYKKLQESNPEEGAFDEGLGFCYLKLKLYDKALAAFEEAMTKSFDNADVYFYAAVALLGGNKPFVTPRGTIDKVEEYLGAAISLDPKPMYNCFMAYVRYDHHYRKFFNVSPDYNEYLKRALRAGLTNFDMKGLFDLLGQSRPEQFSAGGAI